MFQMHFYESMMKYRIIETSNYKEMTKEINQKLEYLTVIKFERQSTLRASQNVKFLIESIL